MSTQQFPQQIVYVVPQQQPGVQNLTQNSTVAATTASVASAQQPMYQVMYTTTPGFVPQYHQGAAVYVQQQQPPFSFQAPQQQQQQQQQLQPQQFPQFVLPSTTAGPTTAATITLSQSSPTIPFTTQYPSHPLQMYPPTQQQPKPSSQPQQQQQQQQQKQQEDNSIQLYMVGPLYIQHQGRGGGEGEGGGVGPQTWTYWLDYVASKHTDNELFNDPATITSLFCSQEWVSYVKDTLSNHKHKMAIEDSGISSYEAQIISMMTIDVPEKHSKILHRLVNEALRDQEENHVVPMLPYIVRLIAALRKLHKHKHKRQHRIAAAATAAASEGESESEGGKKSAGSGTPAVLYRVLRNMPGDAYSQGKMVFWGHFASTTASREVAEKFAASVKGKAIVEVRNPMKAHYIAEFSVHPDEEEWLIEPYTLYRVVNVSSSNNSNSSSGGEGTPLNIVLEAASDSEWKRPVLDTTVARLINLDDFKRLRESFSVSEEDLRYYTEFESCDPHAHSVAVVNKMIWPEKLYADLKDPSESIEDAFADRPWDVHMFKFFWAQAQAEKRATKGHEAREAFKLIKRRLIILAGMYTEAFFPTHRAVKTRECEAPPTYAITQYETLGNTKTGEAPTASSSPSSSSSSSSAAATVDQQSRPIYRGMFIPSPQPVCGISTKFPSTDARRAATAEGAEAALTLDPADLGERIAPSTDVRVISADTMEVIKQVHAMYPDSKIACLNMGSEYRPGGLWKTGFSSLEELLFIRTTLSASLEDYLYPIKSYECIYTKDVIYIRNDMDEGFRFLAPKERFRFDVVTTCGTNLKRIRYEGNVKIKDDPLPFTEDIRVATLNKIRTVLYACAKNGADVLVLGALGCGSYANPPHEIAALFKQAIQEYAGYFKNIYFSILNRKNSRSPENTASVFAGTLVGEEARKACVGRKQNIDEVKDLHKEYTTEDAHK